MRFFILFLLSFQIVSQDINWINNTPLIRSYSSPRTTDLNNDGIDDLILGGGVDGYPTPYGVIAINGVNGNTLWTMTTRNEMFTSPQFFDFTEDNINDILIGGRDAELRLINGSNGELIWEFWDSNNPSFNDEGWYNFYTSQFIEDQTGDGFPDILAANGGDHSLDFSIIDRPPGHILIIDGQSGSLFKQVVVPDSNETYMSPIIYDIDNDLNPEIIFGTGGESIAGNLWVTTLSDVLNEDISNATPLVPNSTLGHIGPPALGDLNSDGIIDIITQGFDGKVTAINGSNFSVIWQYVIPNTESSASPILGTFSSSDNNIDVFATIYSGSMSSYSDYYQVLLDGENGNELWIDSLGLINFCSPIAFDSNNDNKDEVLISVINNNGQYFENELILIDFINNENSSFFGPFPGGNIASTPQIKDVDNNGLLDVFFALQADSLDPFGDGTFYEDGINIIRLNTNINLPESQIAWGSYMGTEFNGQYNSGCESSLGLFAFPNNICPGENNGMINLYVSEGTPPYTYLWSNGETTEDIENLEPGLYSVTVTDADGTCDVISREVSEYDIISFYQSPSCPNGDNGLVYFNSSGCDCNTSFCQFIWELNGDTIAQGDGSSATETYKYLFNISAGTYTATIIHPDGCSVQQNIIVPETEMVQESVVENECMGNTNGFIELLTSEEDSIQNYLWNTGDTTQNIYNLSEGSYSVIINDTLCIDTLYFDIINFQNINGEIVDNSYESINSDTLFLGDSCYTYNTYLYVDGDSMLPFEEGSEIWSLSGNQGEWIDENECINGDWCAVNTGSEYYIYFLNEGVYNLNVYNGSAPANCTDSGQQIEIIVLDNANNCSNTGIIELFHNISINNEHIYINLNKSLHNYTVELFDTTGKKLTSLKNQNNSISISLSKYMSGLYTLRVISNQNVYTQNIIVTK